MSKQRINIIKTAYRLHVSFIIALIFLIICFYLFPRFGSLHTDKNPPNIPAIILIEIPVTTQRKIGNPYAQNLQRENSVQFDEIEMLYSIHTTLQENIIQNTGTESDSQKIAFISDMFPDLIEIKEFDARPIIEASKKIYNFKNYFAYRMNLPESGQPHEPSSPLIDDALGQSRDIIMMDIFRIPLSSPNLVNIRNNRVTLADLLQVKEHLHLLEYFYEESALNLPELYNIKHVNDSYTYGGLSDAVERLWHKGLIKVCLEQKEKTYSAVFTQAEMIENINRILTEIPEKDQTNRKYLYGLMHLFINWS